jgi:hypothetical protein
VSAKKVTKKIAARRAKVHGPRAPYGKDYVILPEMESGHPTAYLFHKKRDGWRSVNLLRGAKGENLDVIVSHARNAWPGAKIVHQAPPPRFDPTLIPLRGY